MVTMQVAYHFVCMLVSLSDYPQRVGWMVGGWRRMGGTRKVLAKFDEAVSVPYVLSKAASVAILIGCQSKRVCLYNHIMSLSYPRYGPTP